MPDEVLPADPIHSVLAFYGIKQDDSTCERFFLSSVAWMRLLGVDPDKISYSDAVTGPTNDLYDFSEWLGRNPHPDFSRIAAFELHRFQPTGQSGWADPLLSVDFSRHDFAGLYAYRLARSTVTRLGTASFDDADREMVDILDPDYGIGYAMPVPHGSASYAVGISVGRDDSYTPTGTERSLRVSRWAILGMANHVYRRGLLRGVYPRNYVAQVHLDRMVGGVRLSEWITQDASRGTLADLGHRLKLWSVDEVNAQAVERELWDAGIIFDWRRHS